MMYKVNGLEVENDGDWMQCTDCEDVEFPLLHWMRYCPMCSIELHFTPTVQNASEGNNGN